MPKKEKTNEYKNWSGKMISLNRDGFIQKWMGHIEEVHSLVSWRDIKGTTAKYDEIKKLASELAGYNFDLDVDDVHIHYDMDGNVDSHSVGKKFLIKNNDVINTLMEVEDV